MFMIKIFPFMYLWWKCRFKTIYALRRVEKFWLLLPRIFWRLPFSLRGRTHSMIVLPLHLYAHIWVTQWIRLIYQLQHLLRFVNPRKSVNFYSCLLPDWWSFCQTSHFLWSSFCSSMCSFHVFNLLNNWSGIIRTDFEKSKSGNCTDSTFELSGWLSRINQLWFTFHAKYISQVLSICEPAFLHYGKW